MWASRSLARSPGTVGFKSSSCPSARVFSTRLFQTSRGGSTLALANPSPPSGWVEDFHLQVSEHAPHTKKRATPKGRPFCCHLPKGRLEDELALNLANPLVGGRRCERSVGRCRHGGREDGITERTDCAAGVRRRSAIVQVVQHVIGVEPDLELEALG